MSLIRRILDRAWKTITDDPVAAGSLRHLKNVEPPSLEDHPDQLWMVLNDIAMADPVLRVTIEMCQNEGLEREHIALFCAVMQSAHLGAVYDRLFQDAYDDFPAEPRRYTRAQVEGLRGPAHLHLYQQRPSMD